MHVHFLFSSVISRCCFLAKFGRGDGNNQECSAPNHRSFGASGQWTGGCCSQ
ncbi:hypothetical protein AMTRI_Chr03g146040 [Amborella trichopoda]